jgi:putative ABC transport system permease protein
MTDAFQVNLTALSLLALVVGVFLIYNAMTFSVVQRRVLFGTLRSLGYTREQVFGMVLGEAALIGALGAALGLGLGILLGQGAVQMVTQTINDLYFVVTVRGVQVPASSLLKGGLVGFFASVLAAAPPAWEAASVPPRLALSRVGLESKARTAVNLAAVLGVAIVLLGAAVLAIPTRDLVVSFSGRGADDRGGGHDRRAGHDRQFPHYGHHLARTDLARRRLPLDRKHHRDTLQRNA